MTWKNRWNKCPDCSDEYIGRTNKSKTLCKRCKEKRDKEFGKILAKAYGEGDSK